MLREGVISKRRRESLNCAAEDVGFEGYKSGVLGRRFAENLGRCDMKRRKTWRKTLGAKVDHLCACQ